MSSPDPTTPPPHLERVWADMTEDEREDVLRWAREHSATMLRTRAAKMTCSISATPAEQLATFRAADHLAPQIWPEQTEGV